MEQDNWRHRSSRMSCSSCMWYVPKRVESPSADRVSGIGRCRFNAPTMKGWPVVMPSDWCGQHKVDEEKV